MSFWKPKLKDTELGGTSPISGSTTSIAVANDYTIPIPGLESAAEKWGKVKSALGPGTSIQGRLSFDTSVRIDGHLSGQVQSSQALIVGKTGKVEATIDTKSLIIEGVVKGPVDAKERIEVMPGGSLSGDVHCPTLVIHDGSFFEGSCRMKKVTTG